MAFETARRRVLQLVGAALGGGAVSSTLASGAAEAPYALEQGDRCIPVEPLSGSTPVEEFYDYGVAETQYSSAGTVDLQRNDTSILFLYDGPNGVSLVVVHDKLGGGTPGGSVSFTFTGLPTDLPPNGGWVVEDDNYGGPDNYDVWTHRGTTSRIDWTWGHSRSDGGVFRGLGPEPDVRIEPSFNQSAALYGQFYEGQLTSWHLLSGSLANPKRIPLDFGKPVRIRAGPCGTSGDGTGAVGDAPADHEDRKRGKHDKQRRKHEKKQRKHRKKRRKHERKEAKHRRKQRKHDEKEDWKEAKHRRKRRKHERKGDGDDGDDGDDDEDDEDAADVLDDPYEEDGDDGEDGDDEDDD